MQGAPPGRSSAWCAVAGLLLRKRDSYYRQVEAADSRTSRRFGLMVNSILVSVVLLSSLTLMVLVLPVVLPPLPPPPPFLMLVPVVIFVLLLLIAFVPSGFNAIVVTYVPQLDGLFKPASVGGEKVRHAVDIQHTFASNSTSSHHNQLQYQANFNEMC